jgi:hypothetical protein
MHQSIQGSMRSTKQQEKGMGRNRQRNVEERPIDWMLRWTRWDHQNRIMRRQRWRLITYYHKRTLYMSYFMYRLWACDTSNNAGLSALFAGGKLHRRHLACNRKPGNVVYPKDGFKGGAWHWSYFLTWKRHWPSGLPSRVRVCLSAIG